jgi:hypothetical protein
VLRELTGFQEVHGRLAPRKQRDTSSRNPYLPRKQTETWIGQKSKQQLRPRGVVNQRLYNSGLAQRHERPYLFIFLYCPDLVALVYRLRPVIR